MAHQARAGKAVHHRCSACGAPAQWDPAKGALTCTWCGGTTTVEAPEEELAQHAIAEAADRLAMPAEAGVAGARCDGCGATVSFEQDNLIAGTCPFCGDHAFVRFDDDGRRVPPSAVLPFQVPREDAVAAYRTWLRHLWFRPDSLRSHARLEEMHGVYLPFWSWRAHAATSWRAKVGRERRHGDHRHVEWTVERDHREHLVEGVLVYASKGLPEDLVREIEPFDVRYAVAYDRRYLSGFAAESYAVDPLEAWILGEARIREEERKAALLQVPGDTYRSFVHRTEITSPTFQHLLLPVWVSAYRYRGRSYRFLVNGRTGEVQGTAPVSWVKVVLAVLTLLAFLGGVGWYMVSNGTADLRPPEHPAAIHAAPGAPDPSPVTPITPGG